MRVGAGEEEGHFLAIVSNVPQPLKRINIPLASELKRDGPEVLHLLLTPELLLFLEHISHSGASRSQKEFFFFFPKSSLILWSPTASSLPRDFSEYQYFLSSQAQKTISEHLAPLWPAYICIHPHIFFFLPPERLKMPRPASGQNLHVLSSRGAKCFK